MKLTAHHMGGSDTALRIVQQTGAGWVKLVHAFDEAAAYKAAYPGLQIIGRWIGHPDWTDEFTPRPAAEVDFSNVLQAARTWPAVDYWESGNEINPSRYDGMRRIAEYDVRFMELCEANGLKACIGNFATGNPGPRVEPISDAETVQRYWAAYRPALERAAAGGHLVGLHEYLAGPEADTWLQFRYRRLLDYCRAVGLGQPRIAITECGADRVMGLAPWRDQFGDGADGQRAYVERLVRYELGLRQDPAVVCACLFTSGRNGSDIWTRHDIDGTQIPELLGEWARANPETPAPPPQPELERPLFSFPGAGLRMPLYDGPGGAQVAVRIASWQVDVYEMRGEWWRVLTGPRRWWVRMRFD